MKVFFGCVAHNHFNLRNYGDGTTPTDQQLADERCGWCGARLRPTSHQKTTLPNMQPILGWPPYDEEDGVGEPDDNTEESVPRTVEET